MNCGQCKYLGEEVTDIDNETRKDVGTGYYVCDYIKHTEMSPPKDGSKAGVIDGSGYYAALVVASDFGCVNFEPKDGGFGI